MSEQQDSKPTAQDMLRILQQKLGNLELTVHAMMDVLDDEEILDQDQINEKAQEIVKEMKEDDIENGENVSSPV